VEVERSVQAWRARVVTAPPQVRAEFLQRFRISLIHHDAALEGEVLSYSEIKAAIDPSIISDVSLIPSYEEIKRFHEACNAASDLAGNGLASGGTASPQAAAKRKPFKLDTVRDLYAMLAPDEKSKGLPFRKENPLHRLYYHDIVAPEKIQPAMRKLGEWLEEPATRQLHVIERAAALHFKLMQIFPWPKETGRTARICCNLLFEEANYPVAVIHSIDRQRYYEALRNDHAGLLSLYLEAVQTSAESEVRLYDEADKAAPKRRKRA
jgi:Fic family protein